MMKYGKKLFVGIIALLLAGCLLFSFGCSTDKVSTHVDIPAETVTTSDLIEMPDVTYTALSQAKDTLSSLGFTNVWHYSTADGIYDRFDDWGVVSQNIEPGTLIKRDEYIELICEWIGPVETPAPETTISRVYETEYVPPREVVTQATYTYVLNTNTQKIHVVGCPSVSKMKDSNKLYVEGTLDEIHEWYPGYTECGNCHARY